MSYHAGTGRATDFTSVHKAFHDYLPEMDYPGPLDKDGNPTTITVRLTKSQFRAKNSIHLGMNSEITMRLLIPIDERNAFDQDRAGYDLVVITSSILTNS